MKVYARRFNVYFALAVMLAFFTGCQTDKKKDPIGAIYIHAQAPAMGNGENVTLLRSSPVAVHISHEPILTEANLLGAKVVNTQGGGFAIALQFDNDGTLLLESYSSANSGRHFVIYGQWGEKATDGRWLAAPSITHRISDGILAFTPDCSREEADNLVAGLNAVAKKIQKAKF
jgi:preprotein translocase subunit SecD